MQLGINTLLSQQFVMATALNDASIFNDHDLVRLLNGRETVSDHQRGTVFLQLVQRGLDSAFRLGIQR